MVYHVSADRKAVSQTFAISIRRLLNFDSTWKNMKELSFNKIGFTVERCHVINSLIDYFLKEINNNKKLKKFLVDNIKEFRRSTSK